MTLRDLEAALEERLLFYGDLLDRMAEAVLAEDAERILRYTELEDETARRIREIRKCLAARRAEDPSRRLAENVSAARKQAEAAAARTAGLLKEKMAGIAFRLAEIRKTSSPKGFAVAPPPPSLVDISV